MTELERFLRRFIEAPLTAAEFRAAVAVELHRLDLDRAKQQERALEAERARAGSWY